MFKFFKDLFFFQQQLKLTSKLMGDTTSPEQLLLHAKQMMIRLGCMGMNNDQIIEFMDSIAKDYDPGKL